MTIRLRISNVVETGAGQSAGLKPGDVIYHYNGEPIVNSSELQESIKAAHSHGVTDVKISVWRDMDLIEVHVPIGPLGIELRETDFSNEEESLVDLHRKVKEIPNETLPSRLRQHLGKSISVNIESPLKAIPAKLVQVSEDHFAVLYSRAIYRYPFSQILSVVEPMAGGITVLVFHLVVYKGATGFGVAIPVDF